MNLKEFFINNPDWTKRRLAEKCDTDVATIYAWVNGRTPSLPMALRIEQATSGMVTVKELGGVKVRKKKGGK